MRLKNRSLPLALSLLLLHAPVWSALAQLGRIERGKITSPGLTNNLFGDTATRPYAVYLPPSYDTTQKRYPVIFVLHGFPGDENSLLVDSQVALNSMIRQRTIGEMIAVFVNGNNRLGGSFYLSSPVIGDNETYISRDLVGLIDTRYRTLAARESRGIQGFSIGGWGAMHLALKFPEIYSVVVAESGTYDSRSQFEDGFDRQLASAHPTNLVQFAQLLSQPTPYLAGVQALFCGLLPNPQRPGLYSDLVYEWTNGVAVFSPSADQRCRNGDVQTGDLGRYVQQPLRLSGIKVVHGTGDSIIPIIEARNFTNALGAAGVAFTYQAHSGGHDYLPALALPFLSAHLQGAELYVAPPRLAFANATNGVMFTFPTQTGVEYRIESCVALVDPAGSWTERGRITGNGQPASITFPVQGERQFFRVGAANVLPGPG